MKKSILTSEAYEPASYRIAKRFDERRWRRKAVAILYITTTLIYLGWRFTIINENSLILSWIYFLAEAMGFILAVTMIFSGWHYAVRKPLLAKKDLKVDVLIPVYREPIGVIRRTLISALQINYPHNTYVLDDGNREEIRLLADKLGVKYLCRKNNIGAKAGNLNFGLEHTSGDFVAVFDADHIAQPHALDYLLGFYEDQSVAMAQSPQDYYNTDAFQYMNPSGNRGLWHDQSWFYNVSQPSKDEFNGSSCVGTGVVYRRSAIEKIGGIPTDTVTEDIHTSLKLHKLGYKTIFFGESLAFGIAASDLLEYYKTRLRWAHGNLAALKLEKILSCSGLSLKQRLSYLSLGLIYLEGWQQLMLFVVPIWALIFGWAPFVITPINVLIVLLFPIFTILLLQEYGAGLSRYWTNEIFSMARWPVHLKACTALFGKKIPWKTSAKNIQGEVSWSLMLPQITLLMFNVVALTIAFIHLDGNYAPGPLGKFLVGLFSSPIEMIKNATSTNWNSRMDQGYSVDLVVVAGFWAIFNCFRILFFILKAIYNARTSHVYFRFELSFPVTFLDYPDTYGVTEKISEHWVRLKNLPKQKWPTNSLRLRLCLPAGDIEVKAVIINRGKDWLEAEFIWPDEATSDALAKTLYSLDWQREIRPQQAFFPTPMDYLSWPLRLLEKKELAVNTWQGVMLHRNGNRQYALMGYGAPSKRAHTLISFSLLDLETSYRVESIVGGRLCHDTIDIGKALPIASLPHEGLDGCFVYRYQLY